MTAKEIYEIDQKQADAKNSKLRETLSSEELSRENKIKEACEILEKAQIPFWLFAEREDEDGWTQYVQYNWFHRIFDKEGNIPNEAKDFVFNHFSKLIVAIDHILSKELTFAGKETSANEIFALFAYFAGSEYKKRQEFIDLLK